MHGRLLPLFPLPAVLLPGTPMPLHIFEDRYKQMVGKALEARTEFGVVQAGEGGILNIGCTAIVERVIKTYPDGSMDIIVVGRRRFEIILLDDEEAYLRAEVAFFDDEDSRPAPEELRALVLAELRALQKSGQESAGMLPDPADPNLSFKAAFFVPDLPFRQTLLALRSETERLKQVSEFLPEHIARVRRIAHVRKVAPTNGHGMTGTPE